MVAVSAATTMVPDPKLLTPVVSDRLRADARPGPEFRERLRRIPNTLNALSILSAWTQIVFVVVFAVRLNNIAVWIAAFLLMGRAHAQLAALMHEAAHRMLFRNRKLNDWAGRWAVGFVSFTPIDGYRRGHMAHHRQEFGPDEPDIPLYRGYPITRASLRRKLTRDATGQTGWKLLKGLLRALRSNDASSRAQARNIVAMQVALIAICSAFGRPWLWVVLWFLPYLTVWRVINRLRSIAEHGGMEQSTDRRNTTHSVAQHPIARFYVVPFWIGWHLAHHVDSGVPMRNLPKLHRELVAAGYITPELEYQSYPKLWRALSARPELAAS